ncbi:hypothetical protein I552_6288 [Mycobacterium xenopi 3993]|nr:hypothetical protein I552_6288 [Mycobacterium xenopi 3993]
MTANNVLPGGRVLGSDPGLVVRPGEPVCHFGSSPGRAAAPSSRSTMAGSPCPTASSAKTATPAAGVCHPQFRLGAYRRDVQQPVGQFPAAVSWVSASQQVREDVGVATMGSKQPSFVPKI